MCEVTGSSRSYVITNIAQQELIKQFYTFTDCVCSLLCDIGPRRTHSPVRYTYIDRCFVCWRKAIRKLLNLPYITHNELLPYICDDVKPLIQLLRRVISWIKGVSNAKNELSELSYTIYHICVTLRHGCPWRDSNSRPFVPHASTLPCHQ